MTTTPPIRVSAPGKCILMGEHAAVYGRPALVASIDRRTTAEISLHDAGRVRLDLPQIGVAEEVAWTAIRAQTARAREAWLAYAEAPSPEGFARVRGEDPAHLVKVALGEAADFLGDAAPPGIALRAVSEIPIGAGFGSSASAAVAITDAYLALRGATLDAEALHALTLEAERRQHGMPSGVDNATVIHGGIVWATRNAQGALVAEPIEARSALLSQVRVIHTGEPAEPTGAVVAAVRRARDENPARIDALLDRMEAATRALRADLENPATPVAVLRERIREYQACLEGIGVVPEAALRIARAVEARGGAAKISGAGGLAGPGAGAMLVAAADGDAGLESWPELRDVEVLDLRLGAEGVRREAVA